MYDMAYTYRQIYQCDWDYLSRQFEIVITVRFLWSLLENVTPENGKTLKNIECTKTYDVVCIYRNIHWNLSIDLQF